MVRNEKLVHPEWVILLVKINHLLLTTNSAVNIILYSYKVPSLSHQFIQIIHLFKSEYHPNQRRGLCVCNYLWHKEHSYRRQFGTSVRFSTFDQLQHIFYNSLIVMSQMGLFCA